MSDKQPLIKIFESSRFKKATRRLSTSQLKIVENEIEKLIENPNLGERKKGDLSHVLVHKFKLDQQLTLLAYSFEKKVFTIFLLQLGPHADFYQKLKNHRKVDL